MISKLTALALLSTVSAQSTVSLFFPASGEDGGFSVGIDASATVTGTLTSYVLNCASTSTTSAPAPTATDSDDLDDSDDPDDSDDLCVYLTDFAILEGPSTMLYSSAVEGVTITVDCSIGGTTTAVCTDRANGTDITTTTFASSDMLFYPVTITAGDAQVTDASTTGSASGSASGSGSGSASGSASKTASSGAAASSKASATGSSATSTGGVPQITAGAWAIGAGAVMAAVAAL